MPADIPRVLIVFNQPVLPADHPDRAAEEDVLYSVKIVCESLATLAVPHESYGITDDVAAVVARLQQRDYDVVFNLFEGTADRSITEVYFAGLLEWLRVPSTGCPSFTLALARHKPTAKGVFRAHGVRTPDFALVDDVADCGAIEFDFPHIVKPASEDASIGIDQSSVVTNKGELTAQVELVLARYGAPVLVEQFIAGREIQVSMIDLHGTGEPVILPYSEIAFEPRLGYWPVYTYAAKWDETSDEYKAAPVKVNVTVPAKLRRAIDAAVRRAYRALQAQDYARVDCRVNDAGEVFVLELNPNPSITSVMIDSGLPQTGVSYDEFIKCLAMNAHRRRDQPPGTRRNREENA